MDPVAKRLSRGALDARESGTVIGETCRGVVQTLGIIFFNKNTENVACINVQSSLEKKSEVP